MERARRARIVDSGTVDVIGLDPRAGAWHHGLSSGGENLWPGAASGQCPHFSTAIVGAASQALSWANPACKVLELQPVYGPAQSEMVDRPIWHHNGFVPQPTGPGLGVEVNEDWLLRRGWTNRG